ncbi:MAG TPA: deoxyribose-phosphate aldolase [Rectinemataceae bacterium]|nr:deoxyribose-phosphate aldolase [Rectinemataceae bacterium]
MDQNQIIQKIVEEVIARMAPATGAQASAGPARSASVEDTVLPSDMPKYIDHTLLKPDAAPEQVDLLCDEAAKYHFYSVCVNSSWVERCVRRLGGSGVKTCAVVGFPLGAMDTRAKSFEARQAVASGAAEIDMVMNVGAMKSKDLKTVREDMLAVRRACRSGIVLKVIIETCLLTDEEKVLACQIAKDIGADFVKTSTGFSKSGATAADIALMRRTVGPKMGVKASGGVRTYNDAVTMIKAGATRIGASSSIAIISGQ